MKDERDCAAWSKPLNMMAAGQHICRRQRGKKTWGVQGNLGVWRGWTTQCTGG